MAGWQVVGHQQGSRTASEGDAVYLYVAVSNYYRVFFLFFFVSRKHLSYQRSQNSTIPQEELLIEVMQSAFFVCVLFSLFATSVYSYTNSGLDKGCESTKKKV